MFRTGWATGRGSPLPIRPGAPRRSCPALIRRATRTPMATRPAPPLPDRDPTAAVSVVVTDLDGTLWHTDDRVAPVVVDALRTLAARGVPLLVATGRRLTSTRVPLARIGIAPPAVVLNGALGV